MKKIFGKLNIVILILLSFIMLFSTAMALSLNASADTAEPAQSETATWFKVEADEYSVTLSLAGNLGDYQDIARSDLNDLIDSLIEALKYPTIEQWTDTEAKPVPDPEPDSGTYGISTVAVSVPEYIEEQFAKYKDMIESKLETEDELDKYLNGEYDVLMRYALTHYIEKYDATYDDVMSLLDYVEEFISEDIIDKVLDDEQLLAKDHKLHADIIQDLRDEYTEKGTLHVTVGDIINAVKNVSVDGHEMYTDGSLDMSAIRTFLTSLPRPADIAELEDKDMVFDFIVGLAADFGKVNFKFTIQFTGDCTDVRNFAKLAANIVDVRNIDGTYTVDVDIPEVFTRALVKLANSDKVPAEIRHAVFDLLDTTVGELSADQEDVKLILDFLASEDFKDKLKEFIDLDSVQSYLEKYQINSENLTKDRVFSLYYRALRYADRVFDYIPARFDNSEVMNFYDVESATFGWAGEVTVNIRSLLERAASRVEGKNSTVDAIADLILSKLKGNPQTTINADVTVNVSDIYKISYLADGELLSKGLLPAGADVNFYANLDNTYDGRAILAWVDQDGGAYEVKAGEKTPMPKKSVELSLVTGFDVAIGANVEAADSAYEKTYDGSAVTLTASVSGGHGYDADKLAYQWYKNGEAISGATSNTYDVVDVNQSGAYYCEVKNVLSDELSIVVCSDEFTVTVNPAKVDLFVKIEVSGAAIDDDGVIYIKEYDGNAVSLTAILSGEAVDSIANVTYQWYKAESDGLAIIDGATSETLEIFEVSDSGEYICKIAYDLADDNYEITEHEAESVTVSIVPGALDFRIEITADGAELGTDGAYSAEVGNAVTLTADVTIGFDYSKDALTYQWYKVDGSGQLISVGEAGSITYVVEEEGTYFFELTYSIPNYEIIVRSEEVTVAFVTYDIDFEVAITVSGSASGVDDIYSSVYDEEASVTLTADVSGSGTGYNGENLTYQWYKINSDGTKVALGSDISYTVSDVDDSGIYVCEVSYDDLKTVASDKVIITITPKEVNLSVAITAEGADIVSGTATKEYDGNAVMLTASISGTAASLATNVKYQWYKVVSDELVKIIGANSATMTIINVPDSGEYVCLVEYDISENYKVVQSQDTLAVSITAKAVALNVNIEVNGENLEGADGEYTKEYDGNGVVLTARVNADGDFEESALTYQWYKVANGENIAIAGATSATLTIINVADSGEYVCIVEYVLSDDNYVVTVNDAESVYVIIEPKEIDFSGASWNYVSDSYYETGAILKVGLKDVPVLPEGVKLVYAGNEAVNAGTYTATVALSTDNYYIVGIATQFQWTIQPAKENPPVVNPPVESKTFEVTVDGVTISVREVNNVVPDDAQLVAEIKTSNYSDNDFSEYVAEGKRPSLYKVFDIKFDNWSGNGVFEVTINDAGLAGKDIIIVHIHNGAYDALEVTVDGNLAKFNVQNFSDFAVVEQIEEVPAQSHWWLWVLLAIIIILLIIIIILIVCLIRKADEPEEETPAEVVIVKREEKVEEPTEQETEVTPDEPEVTPEEPEEPSAEEEMAVTVVNAEPDQVVAEDGTRIVYDRSFQARLSQSETQMKEYYTELKNEILSYKGVRSRVSWHFDSFNKGRTKCVKLQLRGKSMYMYIALPAAELEEKYHVKDVSDRALYEDVPTMLKIRRPRSLKYAKELVAKLMEKLGVERGETPTEQYKPRYRSTKSLIDMGLIKLKVTKDIGFKK